MPTDSLVKDRMQMDKIHTSKRLYTDFHKHCTMFFKKKQSIRAVYSVYENNYHYSCLLPLFKEKK